MSKQFETTVTVASHANYGAFRATDKKFYKPAKTMSLEDFPVGQTFHVKGYCSESGKTHYITEIVTKGGFGLDLTPAVEKPKRRMAPPVEKPGDDKGFTKKSVSYKNESRDFVKEAKGKTFTLLVSALAPQIGTDSDVESVLILADRLLKGIEERGYF